MCEPVLYRTGVTRLWGGAYGKQRTSTMSAARLPASDEMQPVLWGAAGPRCLLGVQILWRWYRHVFPAR